MRLTRRRMLACGALLPACAGSGRVAGAPPAPGAPGPSAVSADGLWRFDAAGGVLTIRDIDGAGPPRELPLRTLDGRGPGRVVELHVLAARRSVLAVVGGGVDELWEIATDPRAEPIFDGLVHDYRMAEAIATPGFLNPRRTRLHAPLSGLRFDRSQAWLMGRAPDEADGGVVIELWQLDVRRRIQAWRLAPDAAAAVLWPRPGQGDW